MLFNESPWLQQHNLLNNAKDPTPAGSTSLSATTRRSDSNPDGPAFVVYMCIIWTNLVSKVEPAGVYSSTWLYNREYSLTFRLLATH